MFRRGLALLAVIGAVIAVTGCNTVAGVGQDISGASRAVQRAL